MTAKKLKRVAEAVSRETGIPSSRLYAFRLSNGKLACATRDKPKPKGDGPARAESESGEYEIEW